MVSNRFVFGITLDQANALDGLIRTVTAHGDILAAGTAPYLDPRMLPALGEAIYTAARAARGILDQVGAQALKDTTAPCKHCTTCQWKRTPVALGLLPRGGLYRLVGANGASVNALGRAANGLGGVNANRSAGPGRRYLIETDPRFVNYDNFISSDYLLDKLGVDPEWTQTRLGDGFYEQRLVLDQITQLTGRRYLGNYDDGVAQYRALLDGGVAEAGALHLDVGVALTAEQVAALTHDIVWMVEQEYRGQQVLVPVVYLSSSTALTLRSDGALLASDNGNVSLNATAGLSNSGTISGVNVSATAGNLLNQGRIAGTGTVSLQAQQDLLNLGGQIAGRDVLLSAGNDLLSTTRDAVAGGDLRSGISADNNLLMNAGHDLTLTGTTVQAGGSAALQAGNNLVL